jgi:biopolymer transport protein ExbD
MKIPQPEPKKARIEIIPMIDAIFFLLVFFMFSSLSMTKLNGANVDLPTASASQANKTATVAPSNRAVISLSGKNELFIDKTPLSRLGLENAALARLKRQPNAVFVVNISKTQNTQSLIDIMDALGEVGKSAGKTPTILIATEPLDLNGNPIKSAR